MRILLIIRCTQETCIKNSSCPKLTKFYTTKETGLQRNEARVNEVCVNMPKKRKKVLCI